MWMRSSSESDRVASCLPIGTTSSKTKCVRSRKGRSLQHLQTNICPGDRRRHSKDNFCVVQLHCNLVLAIAVCKNFPQMFSCLRHSGRRKGPCLHVMNKNLMLKLCAWSSCIFISAFMNLPRKNFISYGMYVKYVISPVIGQRVIGQRADKLIQTNVERLFINFETIYQYIMELFLILIR